MATPTTAKELDGRLIALGAVVVPGTILSISDSPIADVATRTLGEKFHTSIATIQWVLTGNLLGFASVIPVAGWASNRFGAERGWFGALLLFLAGSLLAGSSSRSHPATAPTRRRPWRPRSDQRSGWRRR